MTRAVRNVLLFAGMAALTWVLLLLAWRIARWLFVLAVWLIALAVVVVVGLTRVAAHRLAPWIGRLRAQWTRNHTASAELTP